MRNTSTFYFVLNKHNVLFLLFNLKLYKEREREREREEFLGVDLYIIILKSIYLSNLYVIYEEND